MKPTSRRGVIGLPICVDSCEDEAVWTWSLESLVVRGSSVVEGQKQRVWTYASGRGSCLENLVSVHPAFTFPIMHRGVLGLHVTYPHALQVPFMVSALYKVHHFYLLHLKYLSVFCVQTCVGTQMHTIALQRPTAFTAVTCCTGLRSRGCRPHRRGWHECPVMCAQG